MPTESPLAEADDLPRQPPGPGELVGVVQQPAWLHPEHGGRLGGREQSILFSGHRPRLGAGHQPRDRRVQIGVEMPHLPPEDDERV